MSVLFYLRKRLNRSRLYSLLRGSAVPAAEPVSPERARARTATVAQMPDRRRLARVALGVPARIRRANGSIIEVRCADANDNAFAIDTEVPFAIGEPVTLTIGRHYPRPTFVAHVVWRDRGRVGFRCTSSIDYELPPAANL